MKNYYGVDPKKQREKLLNSETAKSMIESIIEKADNALEKTYEALKISEYMLFLETGNRRVFEKKYFERRNDCSYLSIAYWLTEDDKYKNQLIDLVFHICNEYTWCVPAHVGLKTEPTCQQMIDRIDLFQAETGRLLTDIAVLIGDRLPYYVMNRIEYEIRRRIIEPLRNTEHDWQDETCTNNWASVCAGGAGVALLHFGSERDIDELLPMICETMEHFLNGYNADGCCIEGYSYWNYGFGYFVIFAKNVYEYTNGKKNYFEREKVKSIALFLQKARLGNTKIASFSDGSSTFTFSPGLVSFLKSVYPDDFVRPSLKLGTLQGNVYSMKEFLWFDVDYHEDDYKNETTYFVDAEWFIKRNEKFSFAAKAGNNDEPHNHNDIGSFMIVAGDDHIPLADFGSGEYNARTFDNRYRYTMVQNASFGHSVPIINGTFQNFGAEYAAENVVASDNKFSFDMSKAYDAGIVKKLHRSFELKSDRVLLCDTVEYLGKTETVTERMVSWTEPELGDGCVDLKTARILYNPEKYTASFVTDSYNGHSDSGEIKVFFIDFKAVNERETTFEFEIEIK